jgi:hypothetical protein
MSRDDEPLHIRAQVEPERVSPSDWGELWKLQESQNRASHVHQHHLAAQIAELSLHQAPAANASRTSTAASPPSRPLCRKTPT